MAPDTGLIDGGEDRLSCRRWSRCPRCRGIEIEHHADDGITAKMAPRAYLDETILFLQKANHS